MIVSDNPRSFRRVAGLLAVLGCALGSAMAAPAGVLIRVPAGTPPPAELAPLLARWRQSGQVAGVLLLAQGKSETAEREPKFAALAVLEFPSGDACDAWETVAAPSLPAGLIVRRADVLTQGGNSAREPHQAVFVVNTYTPTVPPARYNEFVQGYIKPLYAAMRATGNLARFTMYLERGETGRVDALSVLEYRDAAAGAAMGKLKTGIREQLTATVPSYAEFDKIKDTLRIDGHGTFGTYTELPAPGAVASQMKRD